MKKSVWWISLIALFLLMGCSGGKEKTVVFEDAAAMVADAKERITMIGVDDLKSKMGSSDGFVLLDIREPAEYAAGSIPGAVNIPRGLLEFRIGSSDFWTSVEKETPGKNDEIIIFCKSGARASLAADSLQRLGYKDVKNLEGGWLGWQ